MTTAISNDVARLNPMTAAVAASSTERKEAPARRRRTGKKRLHFRPPQAMPRGVRELWQSATSEEQAAAHRSCVQVLAVWLGKRSREEAAVSLGVAPLRVWQLSQQALAGMLAGLLIQPKARRRREDTMGTNPDDPRMLRKHITELERKNVELEQLVRLVAQLPRPESGPLDSTMTTSPAAKRRAARAEARAEGGGGPAALDGPAVSR